MKSPTLIGSGLAQNHINISAVARTRANFAIMGNEFVASLAALHMRICRMRDIDFARHLGRHQDSMPALFI